MNAYLFIIIALCVGLLLTFSLFVVYLDKYRKLIDVTEECESLLTQSKGALSVAQANLRNVESGLKELDASYKSLLSDYSDCCAKKTELTLECQSLKEDALANKATLETLLDLQERIVEVENELPEKNTPKNRAMKLQNEIVKYIYEDEGKCKLMIVKVDGMIDNNDNIVE